MSREARLTGSYGDRDARWSSSYQSFGIEPLFSLNGLVAAQLVWFELVS